jgi:hypothetical protein
MSPFGPVSGRCQAVRIVPQLKNLPDLASAFEMANVSSRTELDLEGEYADCAYSLLSSLENSLG